MTPRASSETVVESVSSTVEAVSVPDSVRSTAVQDGPATVAQSATPLPTPQRAMDTGLVDLAGGLPPGALFFLGGLVVLGAVAGWWYWRSYRPLYG